MALIDFHCHLDLYPDPAAVTREVVERGVYVLSVTTTPSAFAGTAALAADAKRVRTALGMHPELVATRYREMRLFETLLHKTAYVGEVGLDGSKPHRDSLPLQTNILMDILLMCAAAGGKILSMHSRGACTQLLDLLEQEPLAGTAILHWFNGTQREIARATAYGCWFSVSARMLGSKAARPAVRAMPRDRVLPETDGPFSVSAGRVIHPWEAIQVTAPLADIWAVTEQEAEAILTDNFRRLSSADIPEGRSFHLS